MPLTEEEVEAARGPAYLAHEGRNHSVECRPFVPKALLPGAQGSEVLWWGEGKKVSRARPQCRGHSWFQPAPSLPTHPPRTWKDPCPGVSADCVTWDKSSCALTSASEHCGRSSTGSVGQGVQVSPPSTRRLREGQRLLQGPQQPSHMWWCTPIWPQVSCPESSRQPTHLTRRLSLPCGPDSEGPSPCLTHCLWDDIGLQLWERRGKRLSPEAGEGRTQPPTRPRSQEEHHSRHSRSSVRGHLNYYFCQLLPELQVGRGSLDFSICQKR